MAGVRDAKARSTVVSAYVDAWWQDDRAYARVREGHTCASGAAEGEPTRAVLRTDTDYMLYRVLRSREQLAALPLAYLLWQRSVDALLPNFLHRAKRDVAATSPVGAGAALPQVERVTQRVRRLNMALAHTCAGVAQKLHTHEREVWIKYPDIELLMLDAVGWNPWAIPTVWQFVRAVLHTPPPAPAPPAAICCPTWWRSQFVALWEEVYHVALHVSVYMGDAVTATPHVVDGHVWRAAATLFLLRLLLLQHRIVHMAAVPACRCVMHSGPVTAPRAWDVHNLMVAVATEVAARTPLALHLDTSSGRRLFPTSRVREVVEYVSARTRLGTCPLPSTYLLRDRGLAWLGEERSEAARAPPPPPTIAWQSMAPTSTSYPPPTRARGRRRMVVATWALPLSEVTTAVRVAAIVHQVQQWHDWAPCVFTLQLLPYARERGARAWGAARVLDALKRGVTATHAVHMVHGGHGALCVPRTWKIKDWQTFVLPAPPETPPPLEKGVPHVGAGGGRPCPAPPMSTLHAEGQCAVATCTLRVEDHTHPLRWIFSGRGGAEGVAAWVKSLDHTPQEALWVGDHGVHMHPSDVAGSAFTPPHPHMRSLMSTWVDVAHALREGVPTCTHAEHPKGPPILPVTSMEKSVAAGVALAESALHAVPASWAERTLLCLASPDMYTHVRDVSMHTNVFGSPSGHWRPVCVVIE